MYQLETSGQNETIHFKLIIFYLNKELIISIIERKYVLLH